MRTPVTFILPAALLAAPATLAGGPEPSTPWRAIATNRDLIPGTDVAFSSFNQPSVNHHGVVVFRARGRGPGEPVSGIFLRRIGAADQPIEPVALRGMPVPQPNNTTLPPEGGDPVGFNEFPSIPRIDAGSEVVATRGMHGPVWTYPLEDGSESRIGTAGIYVYDDGELVSSINLLGAVLDPETGEPVFPEQSVPGIDVPARFDQFPGSPAVDDHMVVTKANFTDPTDSLAKTGIFFRNLRAPLGPIGRIASSDTVIPGQPEGAKEPVRFGSTAPPSAADGTVVFLGVDSEESPTLGGIYAAPFANDPELSLLVGIGAQVPGEESGVGFTRLGEGLSFDGRWIAFWGAWGTETREIFLPCPEDGNPDIIAWCHKLHPDGHTVLVPAAQGMFVHDTQTGVTTRIARTGSDAGDFTDFVYWGFSGRAPGAGGGGEGEGGLAEDEEGELARWRSASFVAVGSDRDQGGDGQGFRVVFKARVGETDGIYSAFGPNDVAVGELVRVGMPASLFDAAVSADTVVTSVTVEREAIRDGWVVVGLSTEDTVTKEGGAGIYALGSNVAGNDANGDGRGDILWAHRGNGLLNIWHMRGLARDGGGMLSMLAPEGEAVQTTADLDGDRHPDILWRNTHNGAFSVWFLEGLNVRGSDAVSGPIGSRWSLVAATELDDDGRDDLVFRNAVTGAVHAWIMEGADRIESGLVGLSAGSTFLGAGDLDGDGRSELLWRNGEGFVEAWFMQGLVVREVAQVETPNPVGAAWSVEAVADLDGDLRDDIVWRHDTRGDVSAWLMWGATRRGNGVIAAGIGSKWEIIDAIDLDGDGRRDLVWRNSQTGDVSGWIMTGLTRASSGFIRNAPATWVNVR